MRDSSILSLALSLSLGAASVTAHADAAPSPPSAASMTVLVPVDAPSRVRLTGPTPGLTLDRRSGVTMQSGVVVAERWTAVCAAPCDALLPSDGHYRVSAPDTEPQYLPRLRGQDAELNADLKGNGAQSVGVGIILAGVGALAIGTGLIISEASRSSELSMRGGDKESVSFAPGIVTLSLSLPLMIIGGIVAGSGQGTLTVSMHDATPEVSLGDGLTLTPQGIAF